MEVFSEAQALRRYLGEKRLSGARIGFVPTMGALHDGHLHLMRACCRAADFSVCSIYVNPAQFNNPDDLRRYPRPLEEDIRRLGETGCDVVFCPADAEMYPQPALFSLGAGYLEEIMEGRFRPGHFRGVALIVAKLFNIVQPDVALFGKKDLQQCVLIRRLVKDLSFPVEVRCMGTVREADGLAMSSRNRLLNSAERSEATVFYRALQQARSNLLAGFGVDQTVAAVRAFVGAAGGTARLEYFEIADAETLKPLTALPGEGSIALCIAGYVGPVRLIDNMIVKSRTFEPE